MHKYQEALGPLDEAIKVAGKTRGAAYPTIAITAKVEALSGLGRNNEALALAAEELRRVSAYHLAGHLYELYQTRAGVYERMGQWDRAISDLTQSSQYANQLSYWRGLTQVDGLLAKAYMHQGALQPALDAINEAIEANKKIPDELYFVPRNLGIKAEILARLGDTKASNELYEKSADLFDALAQQGSHADRRAPIAERSQHSLCGILRVLKRPGTHGRRFSSDRACTRAGRSARPFAPRDYPSTRTQRHRTRAYEVEHRNCWTPTIRRPGRTFSMRSTAPSSSLEPICRQTNHRRLLSTVDELQRDLSASELFVEYVLGDPHSYALAVTRDSVHRYALPPRDRLDQEATEYRSVLKQGKTNPSLGQHLFDELLGGIPEYKSKRELIVVPDGKLHLLPFSALVNTGKYILSSHQVTVVPSGTVLAMLRHRSEQVIRDDLPYVGVAAWTSNAPSNTLLARARRAVSGPERRELVALPESQHEVETIATDLPKPSTILLGDRATRDKLQAASTKPVQRHSPRSSRICRSRNIGSLRARLCT